MSHHLIEFNDVFFTYPDGAEALKGVSFRITHGESVGIVGANGAGKSTLIFHMNGYLMPSKGEVTIGDLSLNKKTQSEIRKRVGVVFQDPDDQLFMPTVYDDVAFGPLNLGISEEMVRKRVDDALRMVGCYELKDRPPHHLSMGEKRAVSIATIIAMNPDILVMDEPSSNLDPRSRRRLIDLLKGFSHTKIIASHDLDLVLEVCERCILLSDGRIVADGRTFNILSDDKLLEDNGLEVPQYLLLEEVRRDRD
ncbi:MAG: ABC transporter ATP-binding protein [Thermodesulfovibrionia bacterium]